MAWLFPPSSSARDVSTERKLTAVLFTTGMTVMKSTRCEATGASAAVDDAV